MSARLAKDSNPKVKLSYQSLCAGTRRVVLVGGVTLKMSIARAPLRAGGRFESLDLQGSPDNAEYAPLGHVEEDQGEELEEFDIAEAHQPKRCASQFWWGIAYFFGAILVLSVIGVVFHWGVPFFLDKVCPVSGQLQVMLNYL